MQMDFLCKSVGQLLEVEEGACSWLSDFFLERRMRIQLKAAVNWKLCLVKINAVNL